MRAEDRQDARGYARIEFVDEYGRKCIRKLSYAERTEVLSYYIRRRSGRKFTVSEMAKLLKVSDRTIQKHLGDLETQGWIKCKPSFNEDNRQSGNIII